VRRWLRILIGISAPVLAYVAGVVPAPASVTLDHCYVTYDQLERQHSRCIGHWSRVGIPASGSIEAMSVSTQWQVLSTDPDANYEWEVAVPESSRSHTALTVLMRAWLVPWFVQVLLSAIAATIFGCLAWVVASRLRRRTGRPGALSGC
jgi:hypothetical protein